ncbi:MAG: hypothetical protein P8Z76_10240, partial [Alphaproteobacteria bacterium]
AGEAYVVEDLAEAAATDLDRAAPLIDKLSAARFLARASDDKLLVARDLRSTTLYDLVAALGLNVAPGSGVEKDAPSWALRLHDLIASNDAAMRDQLSADLQGLIDDGAQ